MGKDKYYTPDIEEFHIGFEYEYKQDFYYYHDNTIDLWKKTEFSGGCSYDGCTEIDNIEDLLKFNNEKNSIRVKYLDEEDILSLGFTKPDSMFTTYKFKEFVISTHRKILHDNNTVITLYSGYVITKNGKTIFEGVIKNKSQLKVLMKQLNIVI